MPAKSTACSCNDTVEETTCSKPVSIRTKDDHTAESGQVLIDHKITLLIAAGAAMAANCETCLNKVIPDLIEAGVADADIRAAVKIGQYVKDKPATIMKQAADVLAGTHLSEGPEVEGCPAEAMR